ncbi:SulP family inorganic anion transporter [Rickettsiales endosymbiont of Stachyamoeba lipophora]|uniref:SulP family inorganic anion transporter n=1 Tax=Rickettsiales endosymbiont of Stachyamoeba lipophora TaxID=2486578 RepID=UPI000F64D17D|nr:SulP family inorganic anion transporter [Rickettsiales endosymbiont of Stachyamoeba lipophora]AZL15626.1 STAS domain-containing protein [Rickettsiales endosymbiont of Stachyamoeba lipophora]
MFKIEIATAIRQTLKQGYNFYKFKSDLLAGFIISLISLPLAMAYSIAVGLPPATGIYTSIVAGFFTSLLGGAKYQISGPAGAFIVILAPIVSKYGLNGLILAQTIAALIMILLAMTRTGSLVYFIPHPVVVGFTSGIAVVLIVISLQDILGINIKLNGYLFTKLYVLAKNITNINLPDIFISISSILIIKNINKLKIKYLSKIPSFVLAIISSILATLIFKHFGFTVQTINDVANSGGGSGNPFKINQDFFEVIVSNFSFETIPAVMPAALVIGILAALESLLAARMADNMTQTKHNPHSEIMGIGISNLLCAFIMGMPATGALARTATNIRLGAKSPIAGMLCALFIYLYIFSFSSFLKYVPLSCLSALLFTVAINMLHIEEVKQILKSRHKFDIIILLTAMLLTAIFDMIAGVSVAMFISFFIKIFEIANLTKIEIEHTPNSKLVNISGTIFFANSTRIVNQLSRIVKGSTNSIIEINFKNAILQDTTAIAEVINFNKTIDPSKVRIYLSKENQVMYDNFVDI